MHLTQAVHRMMWFWRELVLTDVQVHNIYVVLLTTLESSEFFVRVITRWAKVISELRFREAAMWSGD
jgi:hypothetical protein